MVVLVVMAAGVRTMTIAAVPAMAQEDRLSREAEAAAERAVVPNPAAGEGFPIPALIGGIVLAFAVGLTAGQLQRRRRVARRQAALLRSHPGPEPVRPARRAAAPPAPTPPAPKPPRPPRIVKPAPPPPAPPPPPPEPVKPPEPVAPPPEPVEAVEPVAPPPEPVEPPEPVAEPPEPVAAPPEPVEPPEPAEPVKPPKRRKPVRAAAPPPPAAPARPPAPPLGQAPELPRGKEAGPARREPEVSLDAPEAIGRQPRRRPVKPASRRPEPPAPVEADIVPGRRFARERPWPEEAETVWTCEIAWKAGYVKSSFRAMAGPPGGESRRKPIGESPSLRWTLMTDPEPPTPEMVAGVKALVGALLAAGWERTEPGGAWYAQRFLWRGQGEPGPVEVPDPAQPAEPPTR